MPTICQAPFLALEETKKQTKKDKNSCLDGAFILVRERDNRHSDKEAKSLVLRR